MSVVVAFLNPGDFLSEAIQSVQSQSLADWELLLIDDGSTDHSTQLARAAACSDPERIRYFDHQGHANRGKSTSRNVGLREARGRYTVFLDADDVLLPHKLSHQVDMLRTWPQAAAIYGRTRYWETWDPATRHPRADIVSRVWVPWGKVYEPPSLLESYLFRPGSVPCLCALMACTDTLRRLSGFDETIQHLYEDQVLISKLALTCSIYVDLDCGENYRQHAGSSSALAEKQGEYHPWRPNRARRDYLEWLERYIALHGATDLPTERRESLERRLKWWLKPYQHPVMYGWRHGAAALWINLRDRALARMFPEPPVAGNEEAELVKSP